VKAGDNGAAVGSFQEALIALGYPMPRWGADGWYGGETDEAAEEFATDHELEKEDGVSGTDLVNTVLLLAQEYKQPLPASFVDMRDKHPARKRGRRRSWDKITGITLHQTACCFLHEGVTDQSKIDRAVERVCSIGVHHTVLRNGISVWANPYEHRMPHAQAFNGPDVGIEIDGYYAGVDGDDGTFWRPQSRPDRQPMQVSEPQVLAARETCRFIIEEVRRHGGRIRYIHAHRQTSRSRTSDPGSLLWQAVAIPLLEEYGLSYGGPDFFVPRSKTKSGPGRPIPVEWDPSATHGYRDSPEEPELEQT